MDDQLRESPRAAELIEAGLIAVSHDQYRIPSLTPLGREVMAGRIDGVDLRARPIITSRPRRRLRMYDMPPPRRRRCSGDLS